MVVVFGEAKAGESVAEAEAGEFVTRFATAAVILVAAVVVVESVVVIVAESGWIRLTHPISRGCRGLETMDIFRASV